MEGHGISYHSLSGGHPVHPAGGSGDVLLVTMFQTLDDPRRKRLEEGLLNCVVKSD